MLNLARLRVFKEVIDRGSFSAAADALDYTQSAVSQAVARLEAERGVKLIVRDRRAVRPTPAGSVLLEHADGIFAAVNAAQKDLAAVLGLRGGRLRVASFPSAGATLMPEAIASFRRRHPDVALSLVEGEPDEILPRLQVGEVDLALLYSFDGLAPEGLSITPLLADEFYVALPADHRLATVPTLTLWDLRGEEWVQTAEHSPCAQHVVKICLAAGFEPAVSFESDDYETIQGLVAAGVGVALIPRLALSRIHHGIEVRSLAVSPPVRAVVAACADVQVAAPAAAGMLAILTEIAPEYAAVRGWGA